MSQELSPQDLASYFSSPASSPCSSNEGPAQKQQKRANTKESTGGSYDSTITDFALEEAEDAALDCPEDDEIKRTLQASAPHWAELSRCLTARPPKNVHRRAIARQLIDNHEAVLQDVCNEKPTSQLQLQRVAPESAPYADSALREAARRLIGRGAEDAIRPEQIEPHSSLIHVQAWSGVATYLSGRIQSSESERPGRAPDMSPESAEIFRAVLKQQWWEAYEILRRR